MENKKMITAYIMTKEGYSFSFYRRHRRDEKENIRSVLLLFTSLDKFFKNLFEDLHRKSQVSNLFFKLL
jgi:hypothetical protein